MTRNKIALIGAGNIGGTLAHLIGLKNLVTSYYSISLTASHKVRLLISLRAHLLKVLIAPCPVQKATVQSKVLMSLS